MHKLDKNNMPIYLIVLSLILVFPLGIYFLVLKVENHLSNLKKFSKILFLLGFIGILILVIYFSKNYGYYVSLIDSNMSFDMYNFSFGYIYLYLLMVTISCLVGAVYLNNKCQKLMIYTEFINVRHIKDLQFIVEENEESVEIVKSTIKKLIKNGNIINVKLQDDHLVSTTTVNKKKNNLVRCKTCGNIKNLDKKNVRCDFCFRKLTKKDKVK